MNTKSRLESYLLFIILFLSSYALYGENTNYCFKQISTEQGLSQSKVQCVLNDHNGLIWIGTKNGLNRFDQYELINYYNQNSTNSLPSNSINFIAEDSLFNIWIGTSKGLATYNKSGNNFIPIYHDNKPLIVNSFHLCSIGILFGGSDALYIYLYKSGRIEKIPHKGIIPNAEYNHIFNWKKDFLIIGSKYDGIYSFNKKTHLMTKLSFIKGKYITSLYVDKKGQIWVSPYKQGVYCYNSEGNPILHLTQDNSELNNDIILDITEKDGKIWLATDGGGINIYNTHNSKIEILNNVPEDTYSLPEKSIYCLYNDADNNLWAGSIRGGLLRIKEVSIRTYRNTPLNNPYGLSNKVVISLHEDSDGILWIGTDGGGINSYNPRTQKLTHYPNTYQEKVVSITSYSDTELMVSFFSKGIYLFNKKTKSMSPFILMNHEINEKECTSGSSVYLDRCSKDQIMFLGKKIYLYKKTDKKFSTISQVDNFFQYLLQKISTNDSVSYLMGRYHLLKLNHQNYKTEILYNNHDTMEFETASYNGKDKIWIGTNNGLFYYDLNSNKFNKIETSLFNSVSSLSYDSLGRLWIGAQNMLFCYIPNENRFIILGESDGAYPNELFHIPAYKSHSNFIYLGGTSGLICIDKNITFESYTQPTVQLTDIIVNGTSRIGELADNNQNKISIPWNTSSLEIKLSTKEKDIFRKKMFRYNIIGMNKRYVETYSHILSIGTLPPGNYTIMVSCSSQNGIWSLPTEILQISVVPPIWKRAWFISLCSVTIFMIIIGIAYTIVRKSKNELKWKMREHEKKTDEEKIRFLINISHELRTPLTLIYAPLKRILERKNADNDLVKELTGIFKQARQMKSIINMVLDVRKMEVGQDSLHIESHQLNQWVHSVGDDFSNEFNSKGVELSYNFDETITNVSFDSSKCEIILSNLLMNALKFSDSNSLVILSTRLFPNEEMVRIAVIDQGIGLNGVDLNKLFTRFYQGNHDRNGSGIGLSYAKFLIELHKGKIGALNNENKGATFYIDLPTTNMNEIISCQPKPYLNELLYSEEQKKPEEKESFETSTYSLLVVEDEPELRDFLKSVLKDSFQHVYTAENGVEALNIIQNYLPDIVISDVMMPQMDGFELCKRIKSNTDISHIPVILQTARNDAESNAIGYKMGADAYLAKPFETDLLITIIKNLLRNREQIKLRYKKGSLMPIPQESTISNADEQFLLKLNTLICNNIDNQSLDVKFITDSIAMSRSSLYSKIKALTDMGINDYINKFRIEKSIDLLANTNLSITEISEQTGFSYQRYFSSVFKQIKGITPSQFRQEQQDSKNMN